MIVRNQVQSIGNAPSIEATIEDTGQTRSDQSAAIGARTWMPALLDITLLLLAVGAGIGASLIVRTEEIRSADPMWPWWILILSAILGGWALKRMERWLPESLEPAPIAAFPSTSRRLAGLALLLLGVGLGVWVTLQLWPNYRLWRPALLPWLLALACLVGAGWSLRTLGGAGLWRRSPTEAGEHGAVLTIPRWLEILGFLLILGLGIFLRVYRLDEIPTGIYVDETNGALDALYIMEGRDRSPFGTGWYETPNGYIYYMAWLFDQFGATYGALKAASLIPAILTIPALYFLGRYLFGPLAGLSAMLLMAVSRWHLTMSRWGWNETAPPLFQVVATFFLLRGLRQRRALDYALGGLMTGLILYTYLSSRLAIGTIGLFGIYWLITEPGGPLRAWSRYGRGILLFTIAATIAAAPIGVTYITDPFTFNNRVSEINIFNEVEQAGNYGPLLDNIEDHLRFFHQAGDRHGKHNLPAEPQTDPFTGALFIIGLGYALFSLGDRRRGLLWFWLVIAMVGGIFSVRHESPQAYRTLTAVPAIALLAGDVVSRLSHALATLIGRRSVPESVSPFAYFLASATALLLLGSAAVWESGVYFGRQAESTAVQDSFNPMENRVTEEVIAALDEGTEIYLSPRFFEFSPLRYLVYGVEKERSGRNALEDPPYRLARPAVDLPVPPRGGDALFLIDPYYAAVADYFYLFYPGAVIETVTGAGGGPIYLRIRIPAGDLEAVQGLNLTRIFANGERETIPVPGFNVPQNEQPLNRVRWEGSLRIERSGYYGFQVSNGVLEVDGFPAQNQFLARGLHHVALESDRPAEVDVNWIPAGAAPGPIPNELLFRIQTPDQGLLGAYYQGESWEGEPLFRQVTPFLLLAWPADEPIYHPFSARFTGQIRIEQPGTYFFRIEADDGARFTVDGEVVAESLIPDRPNRLDAQLELTPGLHDIQIDYFQRGGGSALEFYWRPPNQGESPVPPSVLIPDVSGQ